MIYFWIVVTSDNKLLLSMVVTVVLYSPCRLLISQCVQTTVGTQQTINATHLVCSARSVLGFMLKTSLRIIIVIVFRFAHNTLLLFINRDTIGEGFNYRLYSTN